MQADEQLFCVFDTNALRRLGALESSGWVEVLAAWRDRDLRTGWVPWVLAELTVTNMRQRNLTTKALQDMQSIVRRHDELCGRRILPDPYLLMWDSIWELAGRTAEPYPDADLTETRRRYLDAFLALESPEQVEVPEGEPHNLVIHNLDGNSGWDHDFPTTFENSAREAIGRLQGELDEGLHDSLVDAAVSYFIKWLAYTLGTLNVPEDVVRSATERATLRDFLSSPFLAGAIEGYYMAERACGDATHVEENDGRDIAVASYLCIAGIVVTNDRRFTGLLNRIFLEPRRVRSFEDVIRAD